MVKNLLRLFLILPLAVAAVFVAALALALVFLLACAVLLAVWFLLCVEIVRALVRFALYES